MDLVARGAVAAGWLPPVKARLLLWALALSGPLHPRDVAAAFGARGTP
jgi:L-asparaginase